ncbi:MAG: LPS assembly lipoprotein LptE, partial [Flavobacteriales bacterium]
MNKTLYLLLFLFIMQGCKVNISSTGADIPAEAETISVSLFPARAPLASPTLSQAFTEDLRDIFIKQTDLDLVEKDGDLQYKGKITG